MAITHDSRQVIPGACFACIPGAVTDGHDHAPEAVARGAVALLVERPLPLAVAQARGARACAPRSVRSRPGCSVTRRPSMRVLGVTGTNGKTTTTYLLEAIARRAGERAGVVGTVGARSRGRRSRPGTRPPRPTTCRRCWRACATRRADTVAMEVSSHALHQHRVDGVQFAAVCFTNLSHEHLDYHGSLDAYFEAKASLFTRARTPAAAVNIDDARGRRARPARAATRGLDVWTYAVDHADADIGATARDVRAERRRAPRSSTAGAAPTRSSTSPSSAPSTSPTPSPPAPPPGRPGSHSRRSWPGSPTRSSCPAGSSGSTPASRSRCWSTTPTPPTRSAGCSPRPVR